MCDQMPPTGDIHLSQKFVRLAPNGIFQIKFQYIVARLYYISRYVLLSPHFNDIHYHCPFYILFYDSKQQLILRHTLQFPLRHRLQLPLRHTTIHFMRFTTFHFSTNIHCTTPTAVHFRTFTSVHFTTFSSLYDKDLFPVDSSDCKGMGRL